MLQTILYLVQHHSPIRFGRETSNKLSVIKLQKNIFLHWCQQQSFISRCWPATVECSFDFTNASLEKPLSIGLMEPGLWPVAPDEFKSGGYPSGAKRRNFFSWRSVQFGKFVVCSSRCSMESVPLLLAMLWVAVKSWQSRHWHGCSALGSHIHQFFALTSYLPLFENSSDLHQSQDWPCRRLGGGQFPLFAPRDDANVIELVYE